MVQRYRPTITIFLALLAAGEAPAAESADSAAARRLAADRGCYNCHGEPARPGIRSFAEISRSYAALRAKPGAERQARDRMHHGGLFSHVATHERLTEEEATLLVHWLFTGASGT